MDDSHLRTHPMLDVPPTPLPASPPVNSLAPDAPLPRAPPKPSNTTILPCDLPLNVTTATQAAAQDPETLGLGSEWRRLLGWGELDHEGTLRSEDDSRMRTHTTLAECPPPPPATRHTESQSMALWDKGLLSVSVKSAQESPHEGDQPGMGVEANEEARRLAPANPSYASCASSPTPSVPNCELSGARCSAADDTLPPRRLSGK